MRKDKIDVEECYLALLLIHNAVCLKKIVIKSNGGLKRWLANQPLLFNDIGNLGIMAARRIFWLLSSVNGFIKRENKAIIVSERGYKFLWADEFKRLDIFKTSREKSVDNRYQLRYRKAVTTIIGKGYRLIKYRGSHIGSSRKYTKAGWIHEFLRTAFDEKTKLNSNSFAFMRAEQEGDWHEHSRTTEIFIFIAGRGHFEIGAGKDIINVPINDNWVLIIEPGVPHKIVPAIISGAGDRQKRLLCAIVHAYPGWESENEYKIGEARAIDYSSVE